MRFFFLYLQFSNSEKLITKTEGSLEDNRLPSSAHGLHTLVESCVSQLQCFPEYLKKLRDSDPHLEWCVGEEVQLGVGGASLQAKVQHHIQ